MRATVPPVEKIIHVLHDAPVDEVVGIARSLDVTGCTVLGRDPDLDLAGFAPPATDASITALVSVWIESIDDRGAVEYALGDAGRVDSYLVTESVPRWYDDRDWADGDPTPGPVLLTLFEQPRTIPDDDFYAAWHGSHTPLSLEIHPLWAYVRNVVARSLTPDARPWKGIVSETFRDTDDMLDPMCLFGGDGDEAKMKINRRRSLEDGARFLDYERCVAVYAMREWILRSFPPR